MGIPVTAIYDVSRCEVDAQTAGMRRQQGDNFYQAVKTQLKSGKKGQSWVP